MNPMMQVQATLVEPKRWPRRVEEARRGQWAPPRLYERPGL